MHLTTNTRALTLFLLCLATHVWAQEDSSEEHLPAFDVERMELNPGRGSLLVGSGELLLERTYRVALATHYQRMPLRMSMGEQRLELIGHRIMALVTGAIGVLPWLEVDLQLPVVLMQTGDGLAAQGLQSPASRGLGTPLARARMGVFSQRAGHAMDLLVDVGLGLPLGSAQVLAREPWPRLHSNVLLGRQLGPVRANLDGGLLLRVPGKLGPEGLTGSRQGQELRLGAALGTVGEGVRFEATIRAALALGSSRSSTELLGGVRYPILPWLEVFGVGGMGFGSLPGTPGFRMLIGVAAGDPPPSEKPPKWGDSYIETLHTPEEKQRPPQPLRPSTDPNNGN